MLAENYILFKPETVVGTYVIYTLLFVCAESVTRVFYSTINTHPQYMKESREKTKVFLTSLNKNLTDKVNHIFPKSYLRCSALFLPYEQNIGIVVIDVLSDGYSNKGDKDRSQTVQ